MGSITRNGLSVLASTDIRRDGDSDLLVIASSGGHLTQALTALPRDITFHVFSNRLDVATDDERILSLSVPRFDTHRNPLIHVVNVVTAALLVRKWRVQSMFSTGGPLALPFAVVAKTLRRPFVFLDTLSRVEELSKTASFIARTRLASKVFSQWPDVAGQYPNVYFAGAIAPVRRDGVQ